MPESLARRLHRQMVEKQPYGGAVNSADWTWLCARLDAEQMDRIEAVASEHDCSMLEVLKRHPELFERAEGV